MQKLPAPNQEWLSLKQAAEILAVHPTTLRRWADSGKVPVRVTPGGHRRFAADEIAVLSQSSLTLRNQPAIENVWADTALTTTRENISNRPTAPWMTDLTEADRIKHRQMGQQLLALTLQFIGSEGEDKEILEETRALGSRYGVIGQDVGMSLTEAMEAAMFFRDQMVESALQLPDSAKIKPQANLRLLRRINKILNEVQLAIAAEYEK